MEEFSASPIIKLDNLSKLTAIFDTLNPTESCYSDNDAKSIEFIRHLEKQHQSIG